MLRPHSGFDPDAEPTPPAASDAPLHRPSPQPAADEEQALLGYVRLVWQRRALVVLLAIAGGALGIAASLLGGRAYEAQLVLGVIQSKIVDDGQAQPADVLLGNFRSILTSQAIARRIVADFRLDQPPHDLTAAQFLLRAVTVESIPGTTLLDLRVRLSDAQLAAGVANGMAERAVELAQGLTMREAVQVRDGIQAQVEESRQNLNRIAEELEAAKKQAQVELREKDIETMLEQRAGLRELIVELAGARAALEKAEQELAGRDRIVTLSRSIDRDPALAEAAQGAGVENILGLTLRDQEVNPTYDKLDEEAALARARVSELERQLAQLTKQHDLDESSLPLLSELYESQSRIARLETDLEIARQVYVDVATRYEQARVQVASRSAQLLVVDAATPPNRPVSRHLLRNLVLGVAGGLLLAMIFVLGSQMIAVLRVTEGEGRG